MKTYEVVLMDNSRFEISAQGFISASQKIEHIRKTDYNEQEVLSVKVIDDTNLY